jgi:type II secretory pathway component PulJ
VAIGSALRNGGGFTFVEILISLALLSLALLGIVRMVAHGADVMADAEKRILALQAARERMETLVFQGGPPSGGEDLPGGVHCAWEAAGGFPSGFGILTVRAAWRIRGAEQEVVLQRLVYR